MAETGAIRVDGERTEGKRKEVGNPPHLMSPPTSQPRLRLWSQRSGREAQNSHSEDIPSPTSIYVGLIMFAGY